MDARRLAEWARRAWARRLGARAQSAPTEPPRPPCAGLWETPMVHVDGRVTTCCLDEGLENTLGNARETPLAELWRGATLHRWRVAQAEGRFEDSGPYCTRCNWRGAGTMPSEAVAEYLAGTHERAALTSFRSRFPDVPRPSHRKSR